MASSSAGAKPASFSPSLAHARPGRRHVAGLAQLVLEPTDQGGNVEVHDDAKRVLGSGLQDPGAGRGQHRMTHRDDLVGQREHERGLAAAADEEDVAVRAEPEVVDEAHRRASRPRSRKKRATISSTLPLMVRALSEIVVQ